jgi:hypothetical protein
VPNGLAWLSVERVPPVPMTIFSATTQSGCRITLTCERAENECTDADLELSCKGVSQIWRAQDILGHANSGATPAASNDDAFEHFFTLSTQTTAGDGRPT